MRKFALALLLSSALVGAASAVVVSTPVGNANYTALSTDQRVVYSVAFTAPRTLTLNSAGATCIGQTCGAGAFEVLDTIGVVSATNTLTITAASGETINGSASSVVIGEPFGRIILIPVTGSDWQLQIYAPGQYPGTTSADNAPAGSLGEFIAQNSGVTSAPLLTTQVPSIVTQVLLTAGDWDCRGMAALTPNPTANPTIFSAWTSTAGVGASPPIPTVGAGTGNNPSFVSLQTAAVTSPTWALAPALARYSLSASTSIFLMADATFGAGTTGAVGNLGCRRAR